MMVAGRWVGSGRVTPKHRILARGAQTQPSGQDERATLQQYSESRVTLAGDDSSRTSRHDQGDVQVMSLLQRMERAQKAKEAAEAAKNGTAPAATPEAPSIAETPPVPTG